jgi:putative transposase
VKWKNIDIGASYYYITATFTEWLPLFERSDVREIVAGEITEALAECGAHLSAYVLMPDHLHLLVYLPEQGMLHRFCRNWRGRSARRILDTLGTEDRDLLSVMAKHANGGNRYAVWKEQVRVLAVWNEEKLLAKVNYIHHNPVRRRLVESPQDWEFSSLRFYEAGEEGVMKTVEFDV